MIDGFNDHYIKKYAPGWISCTEESMIYWLNKYCPDLMCVPVKPHAFGNEYQTICDGDISKGAPTMFCMKLIEGKDWPTQLGPKNLDTCGMTAGLMLQMSPNLSNPGKIVTMDSCFSALKDILAMRKKGVFGHVLTKTRRKGWPVLIPDKYIDEYFPVKQIGYHETLELVVNGVNFIFTLKKIKNM